jgi:hypothetical protein
MSHLKSMTVKELKDVAERMSLPFPSRILKADLISMIETQVQKDHVRAIEDEAFRQESAPATVAPKEIGMGIERRMAAYSAQVGGLAGLTARQCRRIDKKANQLLKRRGTFDKYPSLRTVSGKRKAQRMMAGA